jgi:peptidyl-prolyl cis-trans isomerase A (cyclophilin A)
MMPPPPHDSTNDPARQWSANIHQGARVKTVNVVIETPMGHIHAELFAEAAPITVANFLSYVDKGSFNGGRFHRAVRLDNNSNANLHVDEADKGIDTSTKGTLPNDAIAIEVIQGGINLDRSSDHQPPITLERTTETGITHQDGVFSMARRTPDSAVSDFFICINDQPSLDFGGMRNLDGQGFAAFGKVTEGMDVVRAIQVAPSVGQKIDPVIEITSIRRA